MTHRARTARTPHELVIPSADAAARARRMDELEMSFVDFISAQQQMTRRAFDASPGRMR